METFHLNHGVLGQFSSSSLIITFHIRRGRGYELLVHV